MKRVIQIDSTGCGLACVAMLANESYAKVKLESINLKLLKDNGPFYTKAKDLRKLLSVFKIQTSSSRKIQKWENLPSKAILSINYNEKLETWHWVVFIKENDGASYVLDPRRNIKTVKRKDFGRMRLRSYIPIFI